MMKATISLPDDLFHQTDRLARRLDLSRSELYRKALEEYLARHQPDRVTGALDDLADSLDTRPDAFLSKAALRVMDRADW
jgi:predicted transcriptional regulator